MGSKLTFSSFRDGNVYNYYKAFFKFPNNWIENFEHINIYDVNGKPLNQHADSLRFIQTFGHLVNREQKGDISFQSMPLAMLSKRNREIWAFQAKYKKWQNEKYIDFRDSK